MIDWSKRHSHLVSSTAAALKLETTRSPDSDYSMDLSIVQNLRCRDDWTSQPRENAIPPMLVDEEQFAERRKTSSRFRSRARGGSLDVLDGDAMVV
jgi:hypothetical protein